MTFSPSLSSASSSLLGTHHLHPGQTLSLLPRQAVQLSVLAGGLWVTLGEADAGNPDGSGDLFLAPGERLRVPAGARVVVESCPGHGDAGPARFTWSGVASPPSRFASDVAAPAHEFGAALLQAAGALGRLGKGLVRLIGHPVGSPAAATQPCPAAKRG